jgi:hypothetical protein
MDAKSLHAHLAHFTGSSTFTRYALVRSVLMTEGVAFLADAAAAHWLTDAIASYQHLPRVAAQPFQNWCLRVDTAARSAVLTMTDGNSTEGIIRQEIDYTDFPLDEIALWLCAKGNLQVLMLPGEY